MASLVERAIYLSFQNQNVQQSSFPSIHTTTAALDTLQRQSREAGTYQAKCTYRPNSIWQSNLQRRLKQNNPFENTETGKDFGLGKLFQSYTHNTGNLKT